MIRILTVIALFASLSLKAQVPDNSWHFDSKYRFQNRYGLDSIVITGFTIHDKLGTSLKEIGSHKDTINTSWSVDTAKKVIYRSWTWKGKTRHIAIEYVSWENYETSYHDARYLTNTIYFHTKGRGDIEWHIGEMIVWNNFFEKFRIEYYN